MSVVVQAKSNQIKLNKKNSKNRANQSGADSQTYLRIYKYNKNNNPAWASLILIQKLVNVGKFFEAYVAISVGINFFESFVEVLVGDIYAHVGKNSPHLAFEFPFGNDAIAIFVEFFESKVKVSCRFIFHKELLKLDEFGHVKASIAICVRLVYHLS